MCLLWGRPADWGYAVMRAQFILVAYTSPPWLHEPNLSWGIFWWSSELSLHRYSTSSRRPKAVTFATTRDSTVYLCTSHAVTWQRWQRTWQCCGETTYDLVCNFFIPTHLWRPTHLAEDTCYKKWLFLLISDLFFQLTCISSAFICAFWLNIGTCMLCHKNYSLPKMLSSFLMNIVHRLVVLYSHASC